jgi:hypothetical protein
VAFRWQVTALSSCALSPTATRNPTLAALQLSFFAARERLLPVHV